MPSIETLPFLLKALRLGAIKNHWQERVNCAERNNLSYGEFLAELLEIELTLREQRRLERMTKNAKLPHGKTLSAFDFSVIPSINQAHIKSFAEDRFWVDKMENLILLGPSGVGKTHLAAAIGYSLIEKGVKVLYSSTTLLVQALQNAKEELKLNAALERFAKFPLLILDDIGYVKKSEQETSVLFEFIAHRYETGSLLITSNQAFDEWGAIFPDKVMAVATIDRIVNHATIIKIEGQSFRANHAKKRNADHAKEELTR